MTSEPDGLKIRRDTPFGHWSVEVAVPPGEQRQENARGAHNGKPFVAERLRVWMGYREEAWYSLYGPNMRQDGKLGKLTLERRVTRAYVEQKYPAGQQALFAGLEKLAGLIRADSRAACEQITAAIAGLESTEAAR
jgi:hypothetical protein